VPRTRRDLTAWLRPVDERFVSASPGRVVSAVRPRIAVPTPTDRFVDSARGSDGADPRTADLIRTFGGTSSPAVRTASSTSQPVSSPRPLGRTGRCGPVFGQPNSESTKRLVGARSGFQRVRPFPEGLQFRSKLRKSKGFDQVVWRVAVQCAAHGSRSRAAVIMMTPTPSPSDRKRCNTPAIMSATYTSSRIRCGRSSRSDDSAWAPVCATPATRNPSTRSNEPAMDPGGRQIVVNDKHVTHGPPASPRWGEPPRTVVTPVRGPAHGHASGRFRRAGRRPKAFGAVTTLKTTMAFYNKIIPIYNTPGCHCHYGRDDHRSEIVRRPSSQRGISQAWFCADNRPLARSIYDPNFGFVYL